MVHLFNSTIDWLFNRTQPADALHIAILDPKTDLGHLYYKASLFYHSTLYNKLFEILDCVYAGYNGDVLKYNQPSDHLNDLYLKLKVAFERIDNRPEFSDLQIVDFSGFPDLYGNHHEQVSLWEGLVKDYTQDKDTLKKRIVQQYPLSDDVRLAFYDIDKQIEAHKQTRGHSVSDDNERVIKLNEVTLNMEKSTLQYKDNQPVKIVPTNQEIKLLMLCLQHSNAVVSYGDIAKEMNLNSYRGEVTEEVLNAVKIVKNKLSNLLSRAGFRKNVIESVRNNGYLLNSERLK